MSFEQIIGQEKPIAILQNALANNRLAHAYLFEGQPSVGKVFTALNFAKAVNCLNRYEGGSDCCDQCPSCKKIDDKNHIDAEWISLLKNKQQISIEQIRQMQAQINLKPYEARRKIFCIQDAELMNEEAQSALLKTLEEPPAKSIIILTTCRPSMLFDTIVSRCQLVKFSPLNIESLTKVLAGQHNINADAAYFLAHVVQGGAVDISAYAKEAVLDDKNKIISEFDDFFKKPASDFPFINEEAKDTVWILSVLLLWYRDMLILKETDDMVLIANRDRVDDLRTLAFKFTSEQLGRAINSILNTIQLVSQTNVNIKLALTTMAVDILSEVKNV